MHEWMLSWKCNISQKGVMLCWGIGIKKMQTYFHKSNTFLCVWGITIPGLDVCWQTYISSLVYKTWKKSRWNFIQSSAYYVDIHYLDIWLEAYIWKYSNVWCHTTQFLLDEVLLFILRFPFTINTIFKTFSQG